MQADCTWQEKLYFKASVGPFTIEMDDKSPVGTDRAANPKQLLLASICGCASMDVVSLLKKWREPLEALDVHADAPKTSGQPSVFSHVQLHFKMKGAVAPDKAVEAVRQSMTKFCGVSAMVYRTSPISYEVFLNEQSVGRGQAEFEL